jgi:hypothetical protein
MNWNIHFVVLSVLSRIVAKPADLIQDSTLIFHLGVDDSIDDVLFVRVTAGSPSRAVRALKAKNKKLKKLKKTAKSFKFSKKNITSRIVTAFWYILSTLILGFDGIFAG